MARDAKIVQRGINNTANDLAVPAGTMTDSKNLSFDRDGVAARRTGHILISDGLPDQGFQTLGEDPLSLGAARGVFSLFADTQLIHLNQGALFAFSRLLYDQDRVDDPIWEMIPVNTPHRLRVQGTSDGVNINQIGRMLAFCNNDTGPLAWQATSQSEVFVGTIGNDASNATDATAVQDLKFRTAFDTVKTGSRVYVSDETNIRSASSVGSAFSLLAGSITATGTTDGTTTAARFTSATWMASDGTNAYVVDNGNAIRKVTSAGVVTTLAGSVTAAGSTDGVGTAARFTNLSGLCYSSGFLYATEGASAHRVRKIDVTTGSVTIYAGALSPSSGFTDAVGTAARFNTPTGIEVMNGNLYVGDSTNGAIRRIVISSASVTTYAYTPNASSSTGMVGGPIADVGGGESASALMPGVVLRGLFHAPSSDNGLLSDADYLILECDAPNTSMDTGFMRISDTPTNFDETVYLWHAARSPSALPTQTTGPNKLDFFGINVFRDQDVRGVDVTGGAAFSSVEQPRFIDAFTKLNYTDAMPRMRQLGVQWSEAPSATTTAGTTFAANTAWAYRVVNGLKLPNGRIALGPPSERVIVTTGSQVAGSITAFPAPMLPYDGMPFVQIYRTKTTSGSTTDPGDIMFLAYESAVTYGQGVVWTDIVPDEVLGAELYTNQNAYGAVSSSLPPPAFANEVASFNDSIVLANFNQQASCRVRVLGVTALVSGTSTITFTTTGPGSVNDDACETFTVNFNSSATDPSIKRAQIASSGSAAQNIVQTARNIVRVINRCPDAFMFRAIYDESDPGSFVVYSVLPGRSRAQVSDANPSSAVDERTVVQTNITFSTNASTQFATIALNSAQRKLATVAYSDPKDPDSFPVINQVDVGPTNEAVIRCLPTAETLLAVKDSSIYRIDQTYASQIYDNSLKCSLPNSFARLNNQWIGLFDAGFRALTSSQAVSVGRPIDRRVQNLYAAGSPLGDDDFASAAAVDRQGVYLCAFNSKVFSYSIYGGGAWGTFEMPYAEQPSYIGAFNSTFIPVISNYVRGVFRQLDRRTNPGIVPLVVYASLFYDGAIPCVVASITASGSSAPSYVEVTVDTAAAPLGGELPSDFSGAAILHDGFSFVQYAIVSGNGSSLSPFVVAGDTGSLQVGSSVSILMPIEVSAQYSPSLSPGINSQFGDVGVTVERGNIVSGSLTCTFYNRSDHLYTYEFLADEPPYGQFAFDAGIERENELAPVENETYYAYLYYDFQRFATPSDRSQDQVLAVRLSSRLALAPLAIKSVVVEFAEGGKVRK